MFWLFFFSIIIDYCDKLHVTFQFKFKFAGRYMIWQHWLHKLVMTLSVFYRFFF